MTRDGCRDRSPPTVEREIANTVQPPPYNTTPPHIQLRRLGMSESASGASSGDSRKAQKTGNENSPAAGSVTLLVRALLKEPAFVRDLADLTSVPQAWLLLQTCRNLCEAGAEVFRQHRLPKVCDMRSSKALYRVYRAIACPGSSKWSGWLVRPHTEQLVVPYDVTDTGLGLLFGVGRFSKLKALDLSGCRGIMDAGASEVVRGCPHLQTLNLYRCDKITDGGVTELKRRYPHLRLW